MVKTWWCLADSQLEKAGGKYGTKKWRREAFKMYWPESNEVFTIATQITELKPRGNSHNLLLSCPARRKDILANRLSSVFIQLTPTRVSVQLSFHSLSSFHSERFKGWEECDWEREREGDVDRAMLNGKQKWKRVGRGTFALLRLLGPAAHRVLPFIQNPHFCFDLYTFAAWRRYNCVLGQSGVL